MTKTIREQIVEWNYQFPVDRWWRIKHNVALFSEKHLQISQIDIVFEYLEDSIFEEFVQRAKEFSYKEKEYKKGNFISERSIPEEDQSDLFDLLDPSQFNKTEI